MDTDLTAANGKNVKALEIFAYALQYFKEQALKVGHVPAPVGGGGAPASKGSRSSLEGQRVGLCTQKAGCALMHRWREWKTVQLLWKTGRQVLRRLNTELPCDPATPLLGTSLREMKMYIHRKTCL